MSNSFANLPGGSQIAEHHIDTYGQEITLRNEDVSRDSTSDWDDEQFDSTELTVNALVTRPNQAQRIKGEAVTGVDIDIVAYVADTVEEKPDAFDIRDEDAARPTTLIVGGVEYATVLPDRQGNGLIAIQARRR